MSTDRTRRKPERPEDQASNWFLTLEIAKARRDTETATEALANLDRLGYLVVPFPPERPSQRGGGR